MVKRLTRNMATKLRDRRGLRPADRANLDYKMARKLQAGLDDLAGLLYIMEALPPKKIIPSGKRKAGLKDKHVRLLLKLTESALRILNYKKVRGTAPDLYVLEEKNKKAAGVNWSTGEAIKHGESHRVKAGKEEIEKAILLYNHVEYLIQNFVPETNIEHPGMGWRASIEDVIDMQIEDNEEQSADLK